MDKGKAIPVWLCEAIEANKPAGNAALLELTHAATEEFNILGDEFLENASELDTGAREHIAADFETIVDAYDFDVDIEDVIATREW